MLLRRSARAITRLLVVEDEPLIAFDNEYFLEQEGYEVVATVDNAADALTVIQGAALDAILLDINLAGERSGMDVAKAAQAQKIPVLFLSASLPEEAAGLAMAALAKPYSQRELGSALKAMNALIAGKAPRRVPSAVKLFGGTPAGNSQP